MVQWAIDSHFDEICNTIYLPNTKQTGILQQLITATEENNCNYHHGSRYKHPCSKPKFICRISAIGWKEGEKQNENNIAIQPLLESEIKVKLSPNHISRSSQSGRGSIAMSSFIFFWMFFTTKKYCTVPKISEFKLATRNTVSTVKSCRSHSKSSFFFFLSFFSPYFNRSRQVTISWARLPFSAFWLK